MAEGKHLASMRGLVEPARHGRAQHADRAVGAETLARDDQDAPPPGIARGAEKCAERPVGLVLGQAVQVDAPFEGNLPTPEPRRRSLVKPGLGIVAQLGQGGGR